MASDGIFPIIFLSSMVQETIEYLSSFFNIVTDFPCPTKTSPVVVTIISSRFVTASLGFSPLTFWIILTLSPTLTIVITLAFIEGKALRMTFEPVTTPHNDRDSGGVF